MAEFIVKRSNAKDEYILQVTGYIPEELKEDFENIAENFIHKDHLLIEEIYEEIMGFIRYHKKSNGLVINFHIINLESYPIGELELDRKVTIIFQMRRTFIKWLKETI